MAIRTDYTHAITEKLYDWYYESYDQLPSVHDKIFRKKESKAAYEASVSGVGMGKLQKQSAEMQSIQYRDPMEGYPVYGKNDTFTDGIKFSKQTVDDFPKSYIENILKETAGTWGEAVQATKEAFYADVFNKGAYTAGDAMFNASVAGFTDPSGNVIYDGKCLFTPTGAKRSSKGGGTYYNAIASAALTGANLKIAYDLMTVTNNRNERDLPVSIIPDTLLVPASLKFTAEEILKSEKEPYVTTNTTNVLRNIVNLVVWNAYLTDTNAWFLGCAHKCLIAMDREDTILDYFQDEDTKAFKANIWVRFGLKIDNWRFWVACNAETSA